jgi:hypothetical protein
MIKSAVYVLALGMSATPAPTSMEDGALLLAGGGCCMHRQGSGPWRKVHRDFRRCVEENSGESDKVMEKRGSVWWNPAC